MRRACKNTHYSDSHGRLILTLKPRYNFVEVPFTMPGMTKDFNIFADIRENASGISKLAMRREIPILGLSGLG